MDDKIPIVFVVDDDKAVRKSLERLIKSVGLIAQVFSSAREFLESDPSDGPSCLVLDVRMPGLSGIDLQKELDKIGYKIPIIFITHSIALRNCLHLPLIDSPSSTGILLQSTQMKQGGEQMDNRGMHGFFAQTNSAFINFAIPVQLRFLVKYLVRSLCRVCSPLIVTVPTIKCRARSNIVMNI